MDSLEEEIAARKRLNTTIAKDALIFPELLPTKVEIDEILRILRPLYVERKVADLPFEMERTELPVTMFQQRLCEEIPSRRKIIENYPSRQMKDDGWNRLNDQVAYKWLVCFTKVVETWNRTYTKHPLQAVHGPGKLDTTIKG
jgi:hypothetical protein